MTTKDAALALGITQRSVSRLCKRGTIRAERGGERGRDYWIEDDEVNRYDRERRSNEKPQTDRP